MQYRGEKKKMRKTLMGEIGLVLTMEPSPIA